MHNTFLLLLIFGWLSYSHWMCAIKWPLLLNKEPLKQTAVTGPLVATEKPRLVVLTDISSLSNTEGEPDDGQSLIRLLLYANNLDIEGLIASSNLGHGQRVRPELINQVVAAYAKVQPHLLLHNKQYPSARQLQAVIKAGQPIAGPTIAVENSIGPGKDTAGSEWIIRVVDKEDLRPVWVAIWGGSADLAQALWKVKQTRSAEQLAAFIAKIRVHAIYDQDKTGVWLKSEFPDLFYLTRHHGVRGMYRGGDTALVGRNWVENRIRRNHGTLGALYVNYRGGDIWSKQLGPVTGIKEGDTPSFLSLIPNGLNDLRHPELGGWGGRFVADPANAKRYSETVDSVANFRTDPDERMAALYRWRPDWQADFAARLDWCVQPYKAANHAPVIRVNSDQKRTIRSGSIFQISAADSRDPDGQELTYLWQFYPLANAIGEEIKLNGVNTSRVQVIAPRVSSAKTWHLLLTVKDTGSPALTAYQRITIKVLPD